MGDTESLNTDFLKRVTFTGVYGLYGEINTNVNMCRYICTYIGMYRVCGSARAKAFVARGSYLTMSCQTANISMWTSTGNTS